MYFCNECLHRSTSIGIRETEYLTWTHFSPVAEGGAFAIGTAAAAVGAEQMLCLVDCTLLLWSCMCSSCMDHYIQPCHSADPPPNPPSTAYTAKLTWVRMRSSLHTLPCFCRKLSLKTGPSGYTWTGFLLVQHALRLEKAYLKTKHYERYLQTKIAAEAK